MNHDDQNNPNLQPLIDPELEARVVAWVAGEASAFEAAELTRLISEKPELGIFKRRIEAVHGLAREASRPDQAPLRLSAERRAKLLQTLGANEDKSAPAVPAPSVITSFEATKKRHRKDRQWLLALAACLTVGLFTVVSLSTYKRTFGFGAEMSAKAKREEGVTLLAQLSEESELRSVRYKQNTDQQEAAYKRSVERLAQATQNSVSGSVNEGTARPGALFKLSAPVVASVAASAPVTRYYSGSDAAGERADGQELRDPALASAVASKQVAGKVGAVVLNESFRAATETAVDNFGSTRLGGRQTGDKSAEKSQAKGAMLFGIGSPGQASAPVEAEDEKLELSPFSVTASTDRGYAAANSMGGARLQTELKDVGSAISVVSPQFLRDVGASNGASEPAQEAAKGGDSGKEWSARANFADSSIAPRRAVTAGINSDAISLPKEGDLHGSETDQLRTLLPFSIAPSVSAPGQAADRLSEKKADKNVLDDDRPLSPPPQKPLAPVTPAEVDAAKEPVSTFSLHVSDVSFRLAQAALANDEEMDRASIRPEEFYNAFSYGDPTPTLAEKVSCRVEQSAHPFLQQRNLVRIATKVAASGRDTAQPLHLTVLLDNSGSMEREDRRAIVHRAMTALVSLLGPNDRLTLIGFARQSRLLAESVSGDHASEVLDLIARTPAEGGTNLEEAIKLSGELARRQFEPTAQNRIVLLTDGAANLGNADPALLAASIETLRQQGIAFDACGVGLEGLDDAMLEALTRKGNGRYYVLNSPEAADAGFAKQLAGAFRPAAENVKLQVRFNPARVGHYRLIGFEQHRLREEDFRNDRVDAAELAAEEAAVAVYQVEALPQGEGELGEVYVRFRDAASGNMVERSWTLAYDPQAPAFDRATPSMQLAGTAALLAEKLRGGESGDAIKLSELAPIVSKLRSHYANEPRVQELATMFEQMRRLSGE